MKNTMLWKLTVLLLVLALPLSACGGSNKNEATADNTAGSSSSSSASGSPAGNSPAETVEITFWNCDNVTWQPLYKELVESFNASHPNIKVKMTNVVGNAYFEKLNAANTAKSGPDVYVLFPPNDEYPKGNIEPLDEYIQRDNLDMSQYFQPITDIRSKGPDGKYYGLPRDIGLDAVVYNKDLFDKYGIPYPQEGWTLEDFREIAKQMTHKEDRVYGTDIFKVMWEGAMLNAGLWNYGADFANDDDTAAKGYLDSPAFIEYATKVQAIVKDGSLVPSSIASTFNGDMGGLMSGKIAMAHGTTFGLKTLLDAPFNWGVVSFPAPQGGEQHGWADMVQFVMSSYSKHKDAAWEFMKYLTSYEAGMKVAETMTWGPSRPQVWIDNGLDKDEHLGVFFAQGSKSSKLPAFLRSTRWSESFDKEAFDAWTDMMYPLGNKALADPATRLSAAAEAIEKKLEKNKNRK